MATILEVYSKAIRFLRKKKIISAPSDRQPKQMPHN